MRRSVLVRKTVRGFGSVRSKPNPRIHVSPPAPGCHTDHQSTQIPDSRALQKPFVDGPRVIVEPTSNAQVGQDCLVEDLQSSMTNQAPRFLRPAKDARHPVPGPVLQIRHRGTDFREGEHWSAVDSSIPHSRQCGLPPSAPTLTNLSTARRTGPMSSTPKPR